MNVNGRVNIIGPNVNNQFGLFDKIPINQKPTDYLEATTGNWQPNSLSNTFFSAENIKQIQNGIRSGVYKKSNGRYLIDEQNCDTLKIIMRSIYLTSATNLPTDIKGQVLALNNLVYEYAVPQIYNEAEAYMKYKNDVSTLAVPLTRPAYMSAKGQNPLELKKWF